MWDSDINSAKKSDSGKIRIKINLNIGFVVSEPQ